MRTIFLTSKINKTWPKMDPLLPDNLDKKKLLRITTAGNGVEDKLYLPRGRETLEALGYQIVDYDIEGQSEQEIREKLA